jgi:GNAT superfamily N-acetyltransferase/catechol 2,3-dioxygenase-like lactoylglutathione lyase family enzyme
MNGPDLELVDKPSGSGETCLTILRTLPAWFGIEEAVRHYAEVADRSRTIIARVDGADVGVLTVLAHTRYAAEIHVMAVRPEHHRHGVGRRLLGYLEGTLAASGTEFLQVKTLSPAHPDQGYAATRAFYLACGFRPMEEFPNLWGPANPALQLVKHLAPRAVPSQPAGEGVHHVELWVPNLTAAVESWAWLLGALGYVPFQDWPDGRSWRQGAHYIVLEQSSALTAQDHDRCRPGLNHIAFWAGGKADVDRLVGECQAHGWSPMFADRYPYAGGTGHYAAYLENADGFEVELVSSEGAG